LGEGRSLNIRTELLKDKKLALKEFLKKQETLFAWSAADMPGLSRQVEEHWLLINPGAKLV
jgi:hypothetical protein